METSRELMLLRSICAQTTGTKQDIARSIGVSLGTLNNFLKGEKQPRLHNLNKIKLFLEKITEQIKTPDA